MNFIDEDILPEEYGGTGPSLSRDDEVQFSKLYNLIYILVVLIWHTHMLLIYNCIIIIRLGLNVALIHQNRSYLDSETKENVEAHKRKQRGENDN